jgi:predicted membrane-bound mannosyltransferase
MTRRDIIGADFHLLRFIALYTFIMTVLYSLIPYKTPWCLLGFLHGMIILAAVGAVAVMKLAPNVLVRTIIGLLLVASGCHLAWQACLGSYKYYADPANPYVYAHTSSDVYTIVQRVEDIAAVHPDGRKMPVQVICPEHDYWPLPWYLRSFSRVYWWNQIGENELPAPVIIAPPGLKPALREFFDRPPPGEKNLYMSLFDTYVELRPQVELFGFVTKDLWDSYLQHQAQLPTGEK